MPNVLSETLVKQTVCFFSFSSCLPPPAASQPASQPRSTGCIPLGRVRNSKAPPVISFPKASQKKPPKTPNVLSEILLKQILFSFPAACHLLQPASRPASPKAQAVCFCDASETAKHHLMSYPKAANKTTKNA